MLLHNRSDNVLTPLLYTRSVRERGRLCGLPLLWACFRNNNSSSREEMHPHAEAQRQRWCTEPVTSVQRWACSSSLCNTLYACCLLERRRKRLFWIMRTNHPPRAGPCTGLLPAYYFRYNITLPTDATCSESISSGLTDDRSRVVFSRRFCHLSMKGEESSSKSKSSKASKSKKAPKKPSFIATIKAFFQSLVNPR